MQKLSSFALLLVVFSLPILAADISCTAVNGKAVILHDNGTWNYVGNDKVGICKNFANKSVTLQRANQSRGCGFTGGGWHVDFKKHYNWCMNVNSGIRENHASARKNAITQCKTRPKVGETYLGCYIDKPDRDIKGYTINGRMTNKLCINTCRAKGYQIAATQFASHCFCGSSYGRYGKAPANECGMPCSANQQEQCGGSWRNSVYNIGK